MIAKDSIPQFCTSLSFLRASQAAPVLKNPPANEGDIRDVGLILGQEDPLEEEMATHSSILVWQILRTEEPGWAAVHEVTKSQT